MIQSFLNDSNEEMSMRSFSNQFQSLKFSSDLYSNVRKGGRVYISGKTGDITLRYDCMKNCAWLKQNNRIEP